MHLSIAGDGLFDGTKDKLANGKETMKIEVTEKVNLLTQWTKVPTPKCQQFTQWYNGGNSVLLAVVFQADPASCKVVALDCNDNTNKDLVLQNPASNC